MIYAATQSAQRRPSRGWDTIIRTRFAGVIGVILVVGLSGCGGSTPQKADPASKPATPASTTVVTKVTAKATTIDGIDDDFTPKHLEVSAGTKITFDNVGHNRHDVVPTDPSKFDFSIDDEHFIPGEPTTFTFSKPGTYNYYCSLHATATAGGMRGTITVTP